MRTIVRCSGLILLLLGLAGLAGPSLADGPNEAALVIQFNQDRVETRCIQFDGDTITGGELLADSGLEVIIDASRGMGITLCRVEEVGCTFPAEHCFCQCMGGGPCAYWNYFYRDPGAEDWVYSPLGAARHQASPGSVDAWVWGDGHTPPADDLTFESICGVAATAAATSTVQIEAQAPASPTVAAPTPITPEATPPPAATQAASAQPTAPAVAQAATPVPATVAPAATAAPTPAAVSNAAAGLASYWPFGLAVLALALIGAIAWLRRA